MWKIVMGAAAICVSAAAPAAIITHRVTQDFSFESRLTIDQKTIVHPANVKPDDPAAPVGYSNFAGMFLTPPSAAKITLPGFDSTLGVLRGVTVTLTSTQSVTGGLFTTSMRPPVIAVWDLWSASEVSVAFGDQSIATGGTTAELHCYYDSYRDQCLASRRVASNVDGTLSMDTSLFEQGDVTFDLNHGQVTRWSGRMLSWRDDPPFMSAINLFAWSGTLGVTYTYDTAGAVPEPATWAMMILGFGGVAGALRRRRFPRRMAMT